MLPFSIKHCVYLLTTNGTPLQAAGNYVSSSERSLECLVLNGKNGSRANFVSRVQKMISVETCFPPFPVSEHKQFRGF